MKESAFWHTVRDHLSPFGRLDRIENAAGMGMADVAYVLRRPGRNASHFGWLELKSISTFPTRPSTALRIDHLTKEQVLFAEGWAAYGVQVHLLLKAPPWILLFGVRGIRGVYDRVVTAGDAPTVAKVAAMNKFPTGPLLRELTR